MKTPIKAAMLTIGAALISQAAHASFTANDLYLGFVDPNAANDYIIDLGQASLLTGSSGVVNLSSDFSLSTYNTAFTDNSVSMGVIGGQNTFPSSYDLFATATRAGGTGNAGVAGSDLSGFNHSQSTISSAEVTIAGNSAFPTAGNGVLDSNKSWTLKIAPTVSANTFYGASGIDPNGSVNSGVAYLDLWEATPSQAYTYMGYFTLNSGANPTLTFTPIPEPSIYSLLGVAGLIIVFRRHQFLRAKHS